MWGLECDPPPPPSHHRAAICAILLSHIFYLCLVGEITAYFFDQLWSVPFLLQLLLLLLVLLLLLRQTVVNFDMALEGGGQPGECTRQVMWAFVSHSRDVFPVNDEVMLSMAW